LILVSIWDHHHDPEIFFFLHLFGVMSSKMCMWLVERMGWFKISGPRARCMMISRERNPQPSSQDPGPRSPVAPSQPPPPLSPSLSRRAATGSGSRKQQAQLRPSLRTGVRRSRSFPLLFCGGRHKPSPTVGDLAAVARGRLHPPPRPLPLPDCLVGK
jgi:hypothetical protein